jgi:hypothetical protein
MLIQPFTIITAVVLREHLFTPLPEKAKHGLVDLPLKVRNIIFEGDL